MKNKPKLPIADLKHLRERFKESRDNEVINKKSSSSDLKQKRLVVADPEIIREKLKSRSNTNSKLRTSKNHLEPNPKLEDFLKRHNLNVNRMIDAKGKEISQVRDQMIAVGAQFAFNTTSCNNGGHTYRNRKGHCVICDTSDVAFQLRNSADGFIYIAGSVKKRMVKIGTTTILLNRENSLNSSNYANTDDWKILYSFYSINIGKIENEVIKRLSVHNTQVPYQKSKSHLIANEVFFCSFDRIFKALKEVIKDQNTSIYQELLRSDKISNYQFRNWIKKT